MRNVWFGCAAAASFLLASVSPASASVIDFTGGTVFFNGGGTAVTNNTVNYSDVASYEEDGFRVVFTFSQPVPAAFSSNIGDYYNVNNDVIHAHWLTGGLGHTTAVTISRIDGALFDLNYFVLTSNTSTGGGAASGAEQTFITASNGFSQRLPPENWGFPAQQIFLGSEFDDI